MVTLIDNSKGNRPAVSEFRHPEKRNRPDNPIQRKPDWIRVKAPGTGEYKATQALV